MSETPDITGITSQAELRSLLRGRGDDEIRALVADLGTDRVIALIVDGIVQRWRPDATAGEHAVIEWDVRAPDGEHRFHLVIGEGSCTAHSGPATAPDVTLGLELADFMRLVSGEVPGLEAFLAGKLELAGDLVLAQQLQVWFAL